MDEHTKMMIPAKEGVGGGGGERRMLDIFHCSMGKNYARNQKLCTFVSNTESLVTVF